MAIEIKIVIDPFTFHGPVPRERIKKEEIERRLRAKERQRQIDERHRQKLIEMGLIRPEKNEIDKD
jgi:hypothetical protein